MRQKLQDVSIGDVVSALEREIAEKQRALTALKAICADILKSNRGAPRKYSSSDVELVGALIEGGRTHRDVARLLRMPVATVGQLAARIGARREGNVRGGPRVRGRVDTDRKHRRVEREDGT